MMNMNFRLLALAIVCGATYTQDAVGLKLSMVLTTAPSGTSGPKPIKFINPRDQEFSRQPTCCNHATAGVLTTTENHLRVKQQVFARHRKLQAMHRGPRPGVGRKGKILGLFRSIHERTNGLWLIPVFIVLAILMGGIGAHISLNQGQ